MRVYVATKEGECIASTSLTDIGESIGSTGTSLRTLFSRRLSDSISVKGWNVYRTELGRIKGRGKGSGFSA